MQMLIGSVLKVSVRHSYLRKVGGKLVFMYQRRVPRDLIDRYPSPNIKINLETDDPLAAARKVERLDRQYENEWRLLRADPDSSSDAAKAHALKMLERYGIDPADPTRDGVALDLFVEKIDDKRYEAEGDDSGFTKREADPAEYLTPVEAAALEIIRGKAQGTLSAALDFYLAHHVKRDSERWRKAATIAMQSFIRAVGDKELSRLVRADGRAFIQSMESRNVATTTTRRYLKSVVAIFNYYVRENDLDLKNPLLKLEIKGEGDDSQQRSPLNGTDLRHVQARCQAVDDEPRWLLAMLSDTGARVAECAGLALTDIRLDVEVPHIVIARRPWRGVKSEQSVRSVPLVGVALWAARRVVESALPGQEHAFPRYVKDGECQSDTASATLNSWMRSIGVDHTCHELRHTMRDRLRDVQCPRSCSHISI